MTETPTADEFLTLACLTYTETDSPERWALAWSMLTPELIAESVHVAAAAADPVALQRHLDRDPGAATEPGGYLNVEPLVYLAYARHDPEVTEERTLAAAALLLGNGGNPNAQWIFPDLPTPFTVLTGALGAGEQGEDRQPAHPHGLALARLLLEAGANPADEQALYNRMFKADDTHLKMMCEFGLGADPESAELLRQQLVWACSHGFSARVQLLIENGVDITRPLIIGRTPWELAVITGHPALADFLVSAGAEPDPDPALAFVRVALAGDRDAVESLPEGALAAARIEYPALMVRAAEIGSAEAVELLIDAGFDVDALGRSDLPIDEPWETALHVAAYKGDAAITRLLLEFGADPTIRDRRFDGTPADWAAHFGFDDLRAMIEEGPTVELDDELLAGLEFDEGDVDFPVDLSEDFPQSPQDVPDPRDRSADSPEDEEGDDPESANEGPSPSA